MEDCPHFTDSAALLKHLQENKDKTRVVVIEEESGYYSSTPKALQIMQKEFPNMEVVTVEPKAMTEKIAEHVDAVIMPGGVDHYPRDGKPFTLGALPHERCEGGFIWQDDCLSPREYFYQRINDWAEKFDFPVMGICLGNQFLALHHGGKVQRNTVEYNNLYDVDVTFNPATLPYLYALSEEEQKKAVEKCELPSVYFKDIYQAHNYCVTPDVYQNLEIAATAQDGTVHAIAAGDRCVGFQFHFEASIAKDFHNDERYKNIFRNFIKAADQYHDAVENAHGSLSLRAKNIAVIKQHNFDVLNRIQACKSLNHKTGLVSKVRGYVEFLLGYANEVSSSIPEAKCLYEKVPFDRMSIPPCGDMAVV